MTAAELFLRNAERDDIAAHFEDRSFSFRELATESFRRAALWDRSRDRSRPPHIGVLLDNTPEYLFWLGAAAISRSVIVGINATYRGAELAQLIDHSECQVLVTSDAYARVLADAPSRVGQDRVFDTNTDRYAELLAAGDVDRSCAPAEPRDLYLLIFTSGSTGFPKAVQCTQSRFAATGRGGATIGKLGPGKAVYAPMPMFHSSALFTGLSSALNGSVPFGTRSKFSASCAMSDIKQMGATMMAYTGKLLNYILATPPSPDDAGSPLELALGNEASEADIRAFAQRFNCKVRDSYGSTEGLIIIRRDSSMPEGALGKADDNIAVYEPDSGKECPRAQFDADGRLLNADAAVGEIVNTDARGGFEGYYHNEEARAAKIRDGIYWSGDLAYRDEDGWFYFAGRSNEWLRVDSENFAAAPVERIVSRHPQVRSAAVYAVPDERVGDRVMAAIEVDEPDAFDVTQFDEFLARQPDMGTKWIPSFLRVTTDLPKLASMKLDKTRLRREAWNAPAVWWRPARGESLRPLTTGGRGSDGSPARVTKVNTQPSKLPTEIDDLTAPWFSEVLDRDVSAATVVDRSSGTTGRARVMLRGEPGIPASVFVKLAPFDEQQRALVDRTGMGVTEARFYRDLASEIPVRVPGVWFAATEDHNYVMVLEDLVATGCRFPSPDDADIASRARDIVEQLAALHAPFWESERFATGGDLDWLTARGARGGGGGRAFIQRAVDVLGDQMDASFHRIADIYLSRTTDIVQLWREGASTLVHGDSHIGNLFVDVPRGNRTGFLDWAVVCRAPGLRDVAYTLCNSVPIDVREEIERDLVDRYCELLAAAGVTLDPNEAWDQYRLFAVYSWVAAASTAGMGSKWQPIEIGLGGTRRATAACAHVDSAGLLEARLA